MFYILIILIFSGFAFAEESPPNVQPQSVAPSTPIEEIEDINIKILTSEEIDEKVRKAYRELIFKRFEHEKTAMDERQSVIIWTNRASAIIFVITHMVLIMGIWAAMKEFHNANKLRKENPEQHEIKVSIEGIALKTSLHGSLLLSICVFLYFLFLKYVLPVNVI
jgi:hypothetical protein